MTHVRSRADPALVCPFCRDRLSGETTACARPECGALYHSACWAECLAGYGRCAVYGCESRASLAGEAGSRETSLARGLVLFVPRVALGFLSVSSRDLRGAEGEALTKILLTGLALLPFLVVLALSGTMFPPLALLAIALAVFLGAGLPILFAVTVTRWLVLALRSELARVRLKP